MQLYGNEITVKEKCSELSSGIRLIDKSITDSIISLRQPHSFFVFHIMKGWIKPYARETFYREQLKHAFFRAMNFMLSDQF